MFILQCDHRRELIGMAEEIIGNCAVILRCENNIFILVTGDSFQTYEIWINTKQIYHTSVLRGAMGNVSTF